MTTNLLRVSRTFFHVILCHNVLAANFSDRLSVKLILSQTTADIKKIKLHNNEDALLGLART